MPVMHESEEGDEETFPGLYRGIVAGIRDPQKRHRIRLSIPMVHGDDSSFWAEPCIPPAAFTVHPVHATHSSHNFTDFNDGEDSSGDHSDSLTHTVHDKHSLHLKLPDVGMGVWVMFEAGDPEKPVWMGIWQTPEGGA
jgi:Type VI secretion system/phage-baseplate injector OB domain